MMAAMAPRTTRLATGFAVLAATVVYGGFIVQHMAHAVLPAIAPPTLAVAALLYLGVTRRTGLSDGFGPRTLPVATFVSAVAAPVFAAHAHLALTLPIIKRDYGGDLGFIDASLVVLFVIAGAVGVTGAAARFLVRCTVGTTTALLRFAALSAVVVSLALVAGGALSRRTRPDGFVASLPVVAVIPAPEGNGEVTTKVGDLDVVRRCDRASCGAWLLPRGEKARGKPAVDFVGEIELRRDAVRDLWILDTTSGRGTIFLDEASARAVFRGNKLVRTTLRPRDLRGVLAPPRGWIVAAGIGAALALWALARRVTARRQLAEIDAGEEGTLDEDGCVTLDSGPARLRAGVPVTPGPVVVLRDRAATGPAYRSDGAREVTRVISGTRAELLEAAQLGMANLDARALVLASVTAAPVAMAWIEGLR